MPGSAFFLEAFWELHSDRAGGMGVTPIPFASLDRFAVRHGVEGDEFAFLTRMIRAMDAVALDHWRKDEGAPKPPAGRQLSPELFDALWG